MSAKTFHPIKNAHDGVFNTANGKLINLKSSNANTIIIADISNALSNICRFGGHVSKFYSVAQHSLLVAALAPQELKREGLMHDAAEAYLGDVVKPLKILIGEDYELLEAKFQADINTKYNLDTHKLQVIKKYDMEALEIEHKALQVGDATELIAAMKNGGMNCSSIIYSPIEARIEFLNQFCLLFPESL